MAISSISTYDNIHSSITSETTKATRAAEASAAEKTTKAKEIAQKDVVEISKEGKARFSADEAVKNTTKTDRSAIIEYLKQDLEDRKQSLIDLVQQSINKQGAIHSKKSKNSMWKLFAEGKLNTDEVSLAKAQEEISEDGYWGVNQTSQRLFDFAMNLAGDDPEVMVQMQKAFEKGYSQAEKAWGSDLPSICQKTYDAVEAKFQDYYDSKKIA